LGGQTVYFGKPHAPIYAAALAASEQALGRPLDPRRVLAVGDGMRNRYRRRAGRVASTRCSFSRGIHTGDVHEAEIDEPAALQALFARENVWPTAAIATLRP